jgi:hypothetical protein
VSLRREIEDAVISRLRGIGYFQAVSPYQGSLAPEDDDADVNRVLLGRTPSALVTTGDGNYERPSIESTIVRLGFTVEILLVSSLLRSQENKARGDDTMIDPGIYEIIEDVRAAIGAQDLGIPGIHALVPLRETVVSRGTRAIWQLTYDIETSVSMPRYDDLDEFYLTLRSKINNADDPTIDPVITQDQTLAQS